MVKPASASSVSAASRTERAIGPTTSRRLDSGRTPTFGTSPKVGLKPTTFRQDEVLVTAFSPGGTSLASDADLIPAETAAQVVGAGGLGSFDAVNLRKVLTGSGECGEVNWRFLGLAMPAWVLVCALALGAAGVLANLSRGDSRVR